jgi:uncharacterized membrane protein YfcA
MTALMLPALITALAGFVQGLSGFGFSLIAVPLLSFFLLPKLVLPVILLQSIIINLMVFIPAQKQVNLRSYGLMILTGILGIPAGTWLLLSLPPEWIRVAIGVIVFLFALLLWVDVRFSIGHGRFATGCVGFLSGVLNGSITFSGPPVILFFTGQGMPKDAFRATLAAYFLVLNMVTLPSYFAGKLFSLEVIRISAVCLPALLLGTALGITLARFVPQSAFRKLTLVLVLLMGLLAAYSGLREIIPGVALW